MNIKINVEIWKKLAKSMTPSEAKVLMDVAALSDEEGVLSTSLRSLGFDTGLSRNTLSVCIHSLKEKGAFESILCSGGPNGGSKIKLNASLVEKVVE